MDCAKRCLLCDKDKVKFVNMTKYHGTCGNHELPEFITCIHCKAVVPHIIAPNVDTDLTYIENKVQGVEGFKIEPVQVGEFYEIDRKDEKCEFSEPGKAEVVVIDEPVRVEIGVPVEGEFDGGDFEVEEKEKSKDLEENKENVYENLGGDDEEEGMAEEIKYEQKKEEKLEKRSPLYVGCSEIRYEDIGEEDDRSYKAVNYFKPILLFPLVVILTAVYIHKEGLTTILSRGKQKLVNAPSWIFKSIFQ